MNQMKKCFLFIIPILILCLGKESLLDKNLDSSAEKSFSTEALSVDLLQGGGKKEYFQAHIPSAIVIAMDVPAWGLEGEQHWIDTQGANENKIRDLLEKTKRDKAKRAEIDYKAIGDINALTSALRNIAMKKDFDNEKAVQEAIRNAAEKIKDFKKNKPDNKFVNSPLGKEILPPLDYNGPVHPKDLKPVYPKWNDENEFHGDESIDMKSYRGELSFLEKSQRSKMKNWRKMSFILYFFFLQISEKRDHYK